MYGIQGCFANVVHSKFAAGGSVRVRVPPPVPNRWLLEKDKNSFCPPTIFTDEHRRQWADSMQRLVINLPAAENPQTVAAFLSRRFFVFGLSLVCLAGACWQVANPAPGRPARCLIVVAP